jgi:uncharacterized protein involved in exopolysaccharide biosynthesis
MRKARALFLVAASVLVLGATENAPTPASSDSLTRQIAALELHLADVRIVYEEEDPSVQKLMTQLRELRAQRDGLVKIESLGRRMAAIELHLTDVRTVYGEDHPSVRRLEGELQTLRDQYKALAK